MPLDLVPVIAMFGFPDQARIKRRLEFRRTLDDGVKVVCPELVMICKDRSPEDHPGGPRLGLIVSKKVGGAVVRNKVKRRLRECFRRMRPELAGGDLASLDCVVIARARAAEVESADLDKAFRRSLERIRKRRQRET